MRMLNLTTTVDLKSVLWAEHCLSLAAWLSTDVLFLCRAVSHREYRAEVQRQTVTQGTFETHSGSRCR